MPKHTNGMVGITEDTSESVITFTGSPNDAASLKLAADHLVRGRGKARRKRQEKAPKPSAAFKAALKRAKGVI